MSLTAYRRKRDFRRTAEPAGAQTRKKSGGDSFVVQKHAASHLHYDFRLELDGILKSWAVPKGPSLDPGVRVLAVQVEDHPVEYGGFEGTIPAGQYGGGTVMLWDRGTWECLGDAAEEYKAGRLHFRLHGEKLRGEWTLARMKIERGRAQWLLIKRSDDDARRGDAFGLVERADRSVATGRTMEEIAAQSDRVWGKQGELKNGKPATKTNTKAKTKTKPTRAAHRSRAKPEPATIAEAAPVDELAGKTSPLRKLPGIKQRRPPKNFAPQLATLVAAAPEGDDWLHELKFDGYRILAFSDGKSVRLVTRNGNDWTKKFPRIAAAVRAWKFTGILDGELVAVDERGISHFQQLQNALKLGRENELIYYVFDLPFFAGYDLRQVPLLQRRQQLAQLLHQHAPRNDGPIRFSEHIRGGGAKVLAGACRRGLEGIVSKQVDGLYESRRTGTWLKTKCQGRQEFVIIGFTRPQRSRVGFGALLLGYYDAKGKLQYAGRVGTGFDDALLRDLKKRLAALAVPKSPLAEVPADARRLGVTWVEPKLVGEVEFTEWTVDGALRHPSFQGLRADKAARDVVRETDGVRRKRAASRRSARAKQ